MTYEQLASGIFIRQNLIPRADLQAETVFPGGQYIHPGISQVLSYLTGQNAAGPRMLQTDSNANLLTVSAGGVETLPLPTLVNIIPPRTDTATFIINTLTLPPFTVALFTFRVTAISGTTPTVTFSPIGIDSQGVAGSTSGGSSTTAVTTPAAVALQFTPGIAANTIILPNPFRIQAVIGGTLPSVTWYCDVIYK